jgi:agmatine deiminase
MAADTPAALGYRMPAEWEAHSATWLAWPHNRDTWPHQLEQVQAISIQIMAALQGQEIVQLLVNDADTASQVSQILVAHGLRLDTIRLRQHPTVDAWLRDSGPTFVTRPAQVNPSLAVVDWGFTAWGGKYPDMLVDDALPQYIAAQLHLPRFRPGIALEGGAIDVNGRGTCLTTEQCLLHTNRNPHLQRRDLESYLHDYLAAPRVIWLGEGIAGDDTDGHVDDLARFVNPTTVVCVVTDDPQDVNYAILRDNYRRLQAATDQDGRPLQVVPLPMPAPVLADHAPLPASYANFYIANGVVLVPTYDCPQDQTALARLQDLFPSRRVIGIPCTPLVWGFGAIHCITQQQPVGEAVT